MPEDPINLIQLLPVEGDELLADDELAAVASQTSEAPDLTVAAKPEEARVYGLTWVWDWANGEFVMYGGTPATCSELDNLRQWCEVILSVDRFTHPIYEDDIGIEEPYSLIGELTTDTSAQAKYVARAVEALLVHDRITAVEGWEFETEPITAPGVLLVKYEIVTDDGQTVPLTLQLPLGE